MYAVKSFVWCNKSYFCLWLTRNSFLKELKICVAGLAGTIKIHQSSIAHVCVTKYGSYISGGGVYFNLKKNRLSWCQKACKLSVFLSTVKCLTNMGLYSSLADDVHRITSMWGYDIKPVFDHRGLVVG